MGKITCSNCGKEINVFQKNVTRWFWFTVWSIMVGFFVLLCISVHNERQIDNQEKIKKNKVLEKEAPENLSPSIDGALTFELISIRKENEDDKKYANVTVSVKITNTSQRHIKNAEATCVMKNELGKSIAICKETVIFACDGGLAPSRSIYHDFKLYTYPLDMTQAEFNADTVIFY